MAASPSLLGIASEVLFLCEQHRVDAVIIAAEVEGGDIIEKQLRGTRDAVEVERGCGVCGLGIVAAFSQEGCQDSVRDFR